MKFIRIAILLPLLCLIPSSSVWADDETSITSSMAEYALSKNLAIRCKQWLNKPFADCSKASAEMIAILDERNSSKTLGLVFFYHEFKSFLNAPWMSEYLNQINTKLELLRKHEIDSFDFFRFTSDFCKNYLKLKQPDNFASALIAVVFQDNGKMLQMNWLKWNEPKLAAQNTIYLYEKVLQGISANETNSSFLKKINFYPESIAHQKESFNSKIYYYYMPRYLTQRLQEKNKNSLSSTMPLLMSLVYKYHHHYKSYFQAIWKAPLATGTFDDQMNFTPTLKNAEGKLDTSWLYRYRDLYMAYLGTHASTDRFSFHEFEKMIAEQPLNALKIIDHQTQ